MTPWIDLGWKILVTVVTAAVAVHQWVLRGQAVRAQEITDLREAVHQGEETIARSLVDHAQRLTRLEADAANYVRVNACVGHGERIARIEETLRAVPSTADLSEIYAVVNPLREGLAGLRSDMSGVKDALSEIRRGLSMLTDSLLRADRRP